MTRKWRVHKMLQLQHPEYRSVGCALTWCKVCLGSFRLGCKEKCSSCTAVSGWPSAACCHVLLKDWLDLGSLLKGIMLITYVND